MAKVVIKKLVGTTAREVGSTAGVRRKQVKNPSGKAVIYTVDASSKTFDQDLTYVFGRNVAKARRENKRLTGSLDRVPQKP